MSIESARAKWETKSCPFKAGDPSTGKCISSECAAWKEWDDEYETVWIYKESSSKPGWFSDWEIDEVLTETEEITHGNDYCDLPSTYRSHVVGYRLRKRTSKQISHAGGTCSRL